MQRTALRTPAQVSLAHSGLFSGSLLRAPLALLDSLVTWQERAEQRIKVRQLSDHQLKDIGLTRAEAEGIARRGAW